MTNIDYLKQNGCENPDKQRACLAAMETYGENRWWLSEDKKVLGYHQMFEDITLIPFGKFHEAFEDLVGHPVWTTEFCLQRGILAEEAQAAWDRYQGSRQD